MVERMCLMRPDLLHQTLGVVHLMPFRQMKAPYLHQWLLNHGASSPDTLITIAKSLMTILQRLPNSWVDRLAPLDDATARDIAVQVVRQPTFAHHFLELGTEEIRNVPETLNVRTLVQQSPSKMIYI